jgi:hypothetical protein
MVLYDTLHPAALASAMPSTFKVGEDPVVVCAAFGANPFKVKVMKVISGNSPTGSANGQPTCGDCFYEKIPYAPGCCPAELDGVEGCITITQEGEYALDTSAAIAGSQAFITSQILHGKGRNVVIPYNSIACCPSTTVVDPCALPSPLGII